MRYATMVGVGLSLVIGAEVADGQGPGVGAIGLAKEAGDWLYPKAKVVSTAESSGRIFQAVQTTDDRLDLVLKHYDKKCGTSLADDHNTPGAISTRSEFADGKSTSTLEVDDSAVRVPTRVEGTPRGVMLRQMTRDEPGFFVTVLVTRTKDDAATHLLITYLRK
jgi:hypothetical protein